MKRILAALLIFTAVSQNLLAIDMDKIVAYPVPFNPEKHNRIEIDNPSVSAGGPYNIKIEIFDINGDLVTRRSASQFPVFWNGRNSSGKYVKPGMYIIRVVAENDNEYGRKTIRILVNY